LIDSSTVLAVVGVILTAAATLFGSKWQNALSDLADMTQKLNAVIVAAKDGTVDEADFQKVVDDAKAFLSNL
jgi:hypothetical protein